MKRKWLLGLALAVALVLLSHTAALAGDDYFVEDSDVRKLTKSELSAYTLDELGYIRNEILARHGFPFKTKKYKNYFENQDWYYRDDDFDYNWLSSTEMSNVDLIKQIEQEKQRGGGDDDYDDDYGDGDYYIDDSDVRLLTKSELRSYSLEELGYIRNEILARHGYPFKTEKYKNYFESQWWYTTDEDFDYNWLSSTEMKNVELVKQIEQEKSR